MYVSEIKEYQYFAGGKWCAAENKKLFDVFRPYDRSVYARVPAGGRAEAKLAVEAAAKAANILSWRAVISPVAAGNTVVVKPSELAPISAGLILAQIAEEAGFPPGVINVVTHAPGAAGEIADVFFESQDVEETFGPVVVVEVVDTPEQAVEAANRTLYGLTSSILAGNTYRAFELAPKILAGIVNVNSPTVNDEIHAPMGGVRDSGWGRTGPDSLKEFQDVIWINSHSGQRQYPI
jgi:acyl-CoA reductase-like NAD-dependent aldehyde dehydrogenase